MGILKFLRKNENKKKAYDPVCGMKADPEKSMFKSEFEGKTYYFCAENCKKHFDENPENFI